MAYPCSRNHLKHFDLADGDFADLWVGLCLQEFFDGHHFARALHTAASGFWRSCGPEIERRRGDIVYNERMEIGVSSVSHLVPTFVHNSIRARPNFLCGSERCRGRSMGGRCVTVAMHPSVLRAPFTRDRVEVGGESGCAFSVGSKSDSILTSVECAGGSCG